MMSAPQFAPLRFGVCTYNIWSTTRWPERRDALSSFARVVCPDVLCLQEVQPESLATLDESLPNHVRVHDEFGGWSNEGNIYWRNDLFECVGYGVADIGMMEPLRRLFWVLLRLRDGPGREVRVATAHFTWHGHTYALETERNVRIPQARAVVAEMDNLDRGGEAQLFMGDLNDSTEPISVLREGGFTDCFRAVGQESDFTHPAAPTARGVPQTIDWIMSRGAVRPILGHVVDYFHEDLAPSDHKPVMAVFETA